MRRWVVLIWLASLFFIIGALFWYNELIYQLPTPVPKKYNPVYRGQFISLKGSFAYDSSQPIFLHFFNPDCPCSRFNIASFKSLVSQYGNRIHFVVVVVNNHSYTAKQIKEKFDLDVPVVLDAAIAKACGVYSTPQAVLLNAGMSYTTVVIITAAGTVPMKEQTTQKWLLPAC